MALAFALAARLACAAAPAGSLVEAVGDVRLVRAGTAVAAAPGATLLEGDEVRTQGRAKAVLGFCGDRYATLTSFGSLVLEECACAGTPRRQVAFRLTSGRLFLALGGERDGGPTVSVAAGHAVAAARGGTVGVALEGDAVWVAVLEGAALVSATPSDDAAGATVEVAPGWETRVPVNARIPAPPRRRQEAWMRGGMQAARMQADRRRGRGKL